MSDEREIICPACDAILAEPITPRVLTVGKIKGEVWVCKSCAARAVDHIGYAAHLLIEALKDTVSERHHKADPGEPF
jgi:RNase P subunit RPR2